MANDTIDDELDLDEQERQRRAAAASAPPSQTAPASIGTPIIPQKAPTPEMTPPEVPNQPIPAASPSGAIGTNIMAPPKAPTELPQYHGLNRVLDTLGGATKIGTAIERASGLGTQGALARIQNEQGIEKTNADIGNTQAEESLRNAQAGNVAATAESTKVGDELVGVTLPDGSKTQVMRKNLASPTAAIISGASRENVADTNAGARTDVADTNAAAREGAAQIMVNGKPMATKQIMGSDSKPHVMMWNPNTHTYDRDLGVAPTPSATSAYANTRTTTLIDPESGLPTVYQFDPTTQTYSKQVGVSATGAYGHEMAQAGAVERSGTQLIQDIKSHAKDLGTLGAWVEKYGLNTPIADPELARLQSELSTFAALQPAMHGFRARSAMESFQNIIGGLQKNPEATIASIEGILQTAKNINPTQPKSAAPAGGGAKSKFGDWIKTHQPGV